MNKKTASSQSTSKRPPRKHCNQLSGKAWLQNSISVWSDLRKNQTETRLKHPALFPQMLVERLMETFLTPEGKIVLDPFAGSGSTIVTAEQQGKQGIGFEISPTYVELTQQRLLELTQNQQQSDSEPASQKQNHKPQSVVYQTSAENLLQYLQPESVDLCISSPPYWDILNQRRTADLKKVRHYGNLEEDLGTIADYQEFLENVTQIFQKVLTTLKPGAYCCIIVMDLRKKSQFFPFHSDLAYRLRDIGYIFDDLIIWNRQSEYNNLRPLGYPTVFRINKVHEFILLMQKPKAPK